MPDRRSFLRNGLLVSAGVAALTVASVSEARPARASNPDPQGLWFWCKNCAQIFYDGTGNGAAGGCPFNFPVSGGTALPHQAPDSPTLYALTWGDPTISGEIQEGWRYCTGCKALTWYAAKSVGYQCPTYGYHEVGSTLYDVYMEDPGNGLTYQAGWTYCGWCRDLYHGSGGEAGICMSSSWISWDASTIWDNLPHAPASSSPTNYRVQYS
jgi:hypothetical protein